MRKLMALMMVAGIAAACGQSAAEKQADEIKAQAQKVAAAAEQVGKAAEASAKASGDAGADLAKAMQGMAAAMGGSKDGKPVEPVSIDVLKSALPSISGYEMSNPKSERMTAPFPMAQTETKYKKGDSEIEVSIIDTGMAQLLVAPWKMMMAAGYSKETDEGYEKATTVAGNPAWEKWNKSSKSGEVGMFVGNRFMVSIKGDDLSNISQLHDVAAKIDQSKLQVK